MDGKEYEMGTKKACLTPVVQPGRHKFNLSFHMYIALKKIETSNRKLCILPGPNVSISGYYIEYIATVLR